MTLPVCPNCRAVDNVEPDIRQQGANHCRSCGYVAMVVEFHTPTNQGSVVERRGFKGLDELTKPARRPAYQRNPDLQGRHFWWQDQ